MSEQTSTAPVNWNQRIIDEFRANEGKVGGPFEGVDLLLLTFSGARTGTVRTTPVWYMEDGDRLVVFATNAGSAKNPAWYYNVLAKPQVTVEIGTRRYETEIQSISGSERDQLFERAQELAPVFTEYQAKVARTIPAVAIARESA